jgi:hypothetical protein
MLSGRAILVSVALLAASVAAAASWKDAPPAGIAAGDVVFRRGSGVWTVFFVSASQREKRFSHVGITVPDGKGGFSVLHAEANDLGKGRVKIDSWSSFFKGSTQAAVFRCACEDVDPADIVKEGMRRLGVPFDNAFDISSEEKLYCTELVMVAVNSAARRKVISPSCRGKTEIVALDDVYREGFVKIFDSDS